MRPLAFVIESESPSIAATIELRPITVLFGRTGSGKSSILRGIADVIRPTGAHRQPLSTFDSYPLLVLQSITDSDKRIAREFFTHAISNLCAGFGYSPVEYDLYGSLGDQIPWWERTGKEDEPPTRDRVSHAWFEWLGNEARWTEDARSTLTYGVESHRLKHVDALLTFVLDDPLIGISTNAAWWMCDSTLISEELWAHIEHCAKDPRPGGIPQIARHLLPQRGTGRYLTLHDHSVMEADASTPAVGNSPVGSLLTSNAVEDITWTIAQGLRRLHLGGGAVNDLRTATIRHLPPFVQRVGTLVLESVEEREFVHVRLGFETATGFISHDLLSSGVRSWLSLAISLGLSQVALTDPGDTQDVAWTSWPTEDYPEIVLLDEPEAHLDPLTQEETIRWIEEHASDRRIFVMASHSPVFINDSGSAAHLYGVVRIEGKTSAIPLDQDLLGMVEKHAHDLGVGRAAILQTARGLLMVEGKHDVAVLQTMFREELTAARILVVPLGGTGNAQDVLTEGRFFSKLGARLMLLFDNVRAGRFRDGELPLTSNRDEERIAAAIISKLRLDGVSVDMLPFDRPDIICAIPESTIRRAFPESTPNWPGLVSKYREAGTGNFKDFALREMGLARVRPSDFVAQTLAQWTPSDGRDRHLTAVIEGLLGNDTPAG